LDKAQPWIWIWKLRGDPLFFHRKSYSCLSIWLCLALDMVNIGSWYRFQECLMWCRRALLISHPSSFTSLFVLKWHWYTGWSTAFKFDADEQSVESLC
jgi:hypothetical protein